MPLQSLRDRLTLRRLTPARADLLAADDLLIRAFNSPSRRTMLELYLRAAPRGFLVHEVDGELASMGGVLNYGSFAWLGLVATHPAHRGRQLATRISAALIREAEADDINTLALDASDQGLPIYTRLGFEQVGWTIELELRARPRLADTDRVSVAGPADIAEAVERDATVFGGDRRELLRDFLSLAGTIVHVTRTDDGALSGYLASHGQAIGPGFADDGPSAAALATRVLAEADLGARVLLPSGSQFGDLLLELGLVERRRLAHMRRGILRLPGERHKLLGQISYAAG